jgi:hypothetical protein
MAARKFTAVLVCTKCTKAISQWEDVTFVQNDGVAQPKCPQCVTDEGMDAGQKVMDPGDDYQCHTECSASYIAGDPTLPRSLLQQFSKEELIKLDEMRKRGKKYILPRYSHVESEETHAPQK